MRRSSLPFTAIADVPVRHSLSMAQSIIHELPEINESSQTHSANQPELINNNINNNIEENNLPTPNLTGNELSEISRAGPSSTRSSIRSSCRSSKRRKGRKKSKKVPKKDMNLPPSYEHVMQQKMEGRDSPRIDDANTSVEEAPKTSENDILDHEVEVTVHSVTSNFISGNESLTTENNVVNKSEDLYIQELEQGNQNSGFNRGKKYASAKARVNAARELFKKLNEVELNERSRRDRRTAIPGQHRSRSSDSRVNSRKQTKPNSGRDSINSNIVKGTVKTRKAMLLKNTTTTQCSCKGACSCMLFKPITETTSDNEGYSSSYESNIKYIDKSDSDINSSVESLSNVKNLLPVNEGASTSYASHDEYKGKSRLKRNNSVPTLQMIKDRDLDIYFSQKDKTPSPLIDEMEQPLITPPSNRFDKFPVIKPARDRPPSPNIDNLVKFYRNLETDGSETESSPKKIKRPCPTRVVISKDLNGWKISDTSDSPSVSYSSFKNIDIPSPDIVDKPVVNRESQILKENIGRLPNKTEDEHTNFVRRNSGAIPKKTENKMQQDRTYKIDTNEKNSISHNPSTSIETSSPNLDVVEQVDSVNKDNESVLKEIQSSPSYSLAPSPVPRASKKQRQSTDEIPIYENVLDLKNKMEAQRMQNEITLKLENFNEERRTSLATGASTSPETPEYSLNCSSKASEVNSLNLNSDLDKVEDISSDNSNSC